LKKLLFVIVVALAGWWLLRSPHGGPLAPQAPRPADGVLVSEEPVYGGLDFQKTWMPLGAFQEMPLGTIDVTARILARLDYPRTGVGEVLPTDLVLGWGSMSDNRVIDHVKINLANRGLTVVPDSSAGITAKAARASTMVIAVYSDFHEHAVALDALRVGDVIHLYGWEQKIRLPDGSTWTGGSGQEEIGERAFIAKVLMLQVGDRKVFGNWDAYGALTSGTTP
jgi:hypothetical protein